MSLARTLMNGGYVGNLGSINPARYGHEQGASVIAMESIEELHEIFLESYNYEQADLAAATEGVALEGSQYEAVAEAAVKGMFAKIKEFFVKMWNKVKAFFHSVKRYIDSLVMSGKDFVKKYGKEIQKLDNIKDLTVKMFEYDDDYINDIPDFNMDSEVADQVSDVQKYIDKAETLTKDQNLDTKNSGKTISELEAKIAEYRADNVDDTIISDGTDGKCKSADDYSEFLFGLFRNGAKNSDDKEDRDLTKSDIEKFVSALEKSDSKGVSKYASNADKMYTKAINLVDKAEKKYSNASGSVASKTAELLRAFSSYVSKAQTYNNQLMNAWKSAMAERDSAYKSAIMAAFSNNNKNNKKKN